MPVGKDINEAALGGVGAEFINDTAEHTGTYYAITCLEDTVFATLTPTDTAKFPGTSSGLGNNMSSETIPKGVTIYGRWSTIDLTSGLVMAYLASS